MKKLLLLLLLPLFSTQSLGSLDVYDCEVKINNTVYEDITYDRTYDVDSFIIKFDKNKITFSEDSKKRPVITDFAEFSILGYGDNEKTLLIYGNNAYGTPIHLSHDKEKDDYAYLTISHLSGFDGGIANLIARCTPL